MNNKDLLKLHNVNVDESLELWGDMTSYEDALKEFRDSLNSKLMNLEGYKNNQDCENYQILAHSIKSELKYLGFIEDAEVFYAHELKGKERDIAYIQNNFLNLKATARKILNVLNEYFGDIREKKKILIADDSTIVLSFLEKNIGPDFEILKATSGSDALTILASNDLYAILLDLNMPNLNGFDVLEYLERNKLMNSLPVIIITGDDSEETIKKAFTYPILDVLNKPFNNANIERVITKIKEFHEN